MKRTTYDLIQYDLYCVAARNGPKSEEERWHSKLVSSLCETGISGAGKRARQIRASSVSNRTAKIWRLIIDMLIIDGMEAIVVAAAKKAELRIDKWKECT
jgi:hypothetical protein